MEPIVLAELLGLSLLSIFSVCLFVLAFLTLFFFFQCVPIRMGLNMQKGLQNFMSAFVLDYILCYN